MKKLEDIVLKNGDIVEFDDGNFRFISWLDGKTADTFIQVKSIKRPFKYKTIYKRKTRRGQKDDKERIGK